jgi:hypothetical protein
MKTKFSQYFYVYMCVQIVYFLIQYVIQTLHFVYRHLLYL